MTGINCQDDFRTYFGMLISALSFNLSH